jgi:adenine-specific DNA-methyltransferase
MFVDLDVLFAYLLTNMAYQIFLDNSRQYGNGLVKFEPNDLNKAKVVDLGMLTEKETSDIKNLYHKYKINEDRKYINLIEEILMNVYAI